MVLNKGYVNKVFMYYKFHEKVRDFQKLIYGEEWTYCGVEVTQC